ncbi:response regulator receiver protein, partial [Pelosinus fermentans A11]
MLKVLIADDEEKICQLIEKLIDWQALDMKLSGVANNGIEALEKIEALSPDVVITDIRMPGYDGLDLVKKTRELNVGVEFVIISGYRHFEYAQTAIKYGVSDYLLKPIKKQELTET